MVETLRSGKKMKPSTIGEAQPDLIEMGQEAKATKTRTYKTPCGESFTISEEEFAQVVEIFDYLRKSRDSKNAQLDTLEPESCTQNEGFEIEEKVG